MNRPKKILYWVVRIVAALIMLQTLYFKFSGAPESVYIFSRVGMEPWGRIGVGVMELIAATLILIDVTAWIGALIAFGLMVGAVGMHLTILGVTVTNSDGTNDGGLLFTYAVIVAVCSLVVLWLNRERLKDKLNRIRS